MTEFDLIARFFDRPIPAGSAVAQGIGDDCALLDFGAASQLAVTTDMLVAGRHFFPDAAADAIGHKALAVNLSDLAAAGAQPRCYFLALGLPAADEKWLAAFSSGLSALENEFGCVLAGGDTNRMPRIAGADAPLVICIAAVGEVARGQALTRAGAHVGDDLWVSGSLGDAALALEALTGRTTVGEADASSIRLRLERPAPRVALGVALGGLATSCIDISDGLIGDLRHVLTRSKVGAELRWAAIPRSAAMLRHSDDTQLRCVLAGGDDYELLFTASSAHRAAVEAAAERTRTPVTRVGVITEDRDLAVLDENGNPMDTPFKAYDHFGTYDSTP
ncbi:MAG TPA: thiamine-phosphate kinase [Burkholderiaceae bacterium]|nr:thiamine-phosphate kinase [Burkholderiaceae bacterium]